MRNCFQVCIVIFAILCSGATHAQHTLVLTENDQNIAISRYAYIFKGSASLNQVDSVLQADSSNFVLNKLGHEVDYGVGNTKGWCLFFVRNESANENWILKIQHSRVDTAQLFVAKPGHGIDVLPMTGHFKMLGDRPVHALPHAYPLKIKKGETIACYLYTSRQYGRHAAIVNIQSRDYFETYEYGFNVALGFVCGMVLLASMVGFFLFVFVRQRLYVYYSLYALSFFMVLLADTGFAHVVPYLSYNQTVANAYTMITYYWMGGLLCIFTIELLQLKQHGRPFVYWFGMTMSYAFCISALLLMIPALPVFLRWALITHSYYFAFLVNVYILYILSVSVVKREPIVYLYMLGFYFTSFIALLLTLNDFHVLDFPFENKDVFFLTPLVEILCVAVGIGIHFSKTMKERVEVQQALNETQDQIITIQEDERKRIAQDLHDDVGNSLAAVKNMVIHKRETETVEREINNIIQSIRTISHNLMPVDFHEFSLVDIISHTVNKFKDHPTLLLEFEHNGKNVKLKPITELVIYRIINELINNIQKHSRASKAFIQLMYQEKSLIVTVEDNGTGIKASTFEEGIGLRSIRSRAEYIRAQLKIESDDKGTLIILEVPYENIH